MFKSNFTGTRRSIARLIIATICIVIAVFQVIEGMKMINDNKEMPDITVHDFDMLKYDQVVQGELKEENDSRIPRCNKAESWIWKAFKEIQI